MMHNHRSEDGSTLLIVLFFMGFLSFISLLLMQFGMWQSNLSGTQTNYQKLHQARHLVHREIEHYMEKRFPDTPTLRTPARLDWELEPQITIDVKITSLNSKINLNVLNNPGDMGTVKDAFKQMFEQLGYPPRAVNEIINWIEPSDSIASDQQRYAGYDYSAPGREIRYFDELNLISGFIQRDISAAFTELFTIYGSGKLNIHHLTLAQWQLLKGMVDKKMPAIPPSAIAGANGVGDYLQNQGVFGEIKNEFPFLSKRDDSFDVRYYIRAGGFERRIRAIYTFDYGSESANVVTRYQRIGTENNEFGEI